MFVKNISYLELWWPFCSVQRNHFCYFGEGHYDKQFCEIHLEFGPVVQEEMPFKDISYLELWWPFCSAERNYLCNVFKGYQEEQFCEIIFDLDQRRCR